MIRTIASIAVLLTAVGSARSADLAFTSSEMRTAMRPGGEPHASTRAPSKSLQRKSPAGLGKIKITKHAKPDEPPPAKAAISPAGLDLTVKAGASSPAAPSDDEWKTYVNKYMSEVVSLAANAPEVIAAVQEQNAANAGLSPDQIEALDRQWRAERKVNGGPLTHAKMFNPTSQFLKGFKTAANGPIIEIFIMDDKGLNVAQTEPTSDYMQGDEDKWQKSFGAGPWMTFVDKPEEQDGKKTVQVSTTLVDNDVAIGAMTVSIDLGKLPVSLATSPDHHAIPVTALARDCNEVKADIDAKIKSKGVTNYVLEIADAPDVKEGKVVGTCGGGAKKIAYRREKPSGT
jgi:hypothetical protein